MAQMIPLAHGGQTAIQSALCTFSHLQKPSLREKSEETKPDWKPSMKCVIMKL